MLVCNNFNIYVYYPKEKFEYYHYLFDNNINRYNIKWNNQEL